MALAPYQQVRYYVLLVTDGDPGCAGPSNDACHDAEQALSMLGNNVTTNIVGLGPPAQGTDACLDELALYGNGGAYYPTRASDVNTTLQMVIRDAAQNTCRLDLYMQPSDPSNVRLYQDGVVIPHDQWDFQQGPSPKIELHGSACDTVVLQGTNGLEVVDCAPHH